MPQFKEKAMKTWKLEEWQGIDDPDQELLFFGLFHDRDFEIFHNFKGQKYVFWCGGDILRLKEDYERQRVMKIAPTTKHYCENEVEAQNLRSVGLNPEVIPSFLGEISDYPISFEMPKDGKWKVWMCAHQKREQEYGVDQARSLAKIFDDVEFHIYGVDKTTVAGSLPNVIYHGQVKEEVLDKEIREYHCGLRCNEHDGVSEIPIKSMLLGQYPITRMPYEGVWQYQSFEELILLIKRLKEQKEPNLKAREIWLNKLNKYPWCLS